MEKITLMFLSAFIICLPFPAQSQTVEKSFLYDIDVRQANDNDDHLGVDFNIRYEFSRSGNKKLDLAVMLAGFQTFDRDIPDVNSMTGETRLQGHYFKGYDSNALPPQLQLRYLELFNIPPEEQTTDDSLELAQLDKLIFKNENRYLSYDLHYRAETDNDIEVTSNVFGGGLSAEIPWFHELIDIIPSMLTVTERPLGFKAKPIRAYIGMDYVNGPDFWGAIDDDTDLFRTRFEAAWSTLVLNNFIFRVLWQGEYLISPPPLLENDDREFNSFLQAWVMVNLRSDIALEIKYLDGSLPPVYNDISMGRIGINFILAK